MFITEEFDFGSPRALQTTLREIQRSSVRQVKPRLPSDLAEVVERFERGKWADSRQERKDRRHLPWALSAGEPKFIERPSFQRYLDEVRETSRSSNICGLIDGYLQLEEDTENSSALLDWILNKVRTFSGRSRRVLAWKPFLHLLSNPADTATAKSWLESDDLETWCDDKPFSRGSRIGYSLMKVMAEQVGESYYDRTEDFIDLVEQEPAPPMHLLRGMFDALLSKAAVHHSEEPDEHLINYCLRKFGDPHLDNKGRWSSFSQASRVLVSTWVSAEDLRIFFDELTGDKAGQERLKFWRAYLDAGHVVYSKIFLSIKDYKGASTKLQEHLKKSRHGRLSEKSTSAFLVKIGNYFFIEFSKVNNALYVFRPGSFDTGFLTKRNYNLYDLKDKDRCKEYIGHTPNWQARVDLKITEMTGIRIDRRALEKSSKVYRANQQRISKPKPPAESSPVVKLEPQIERPKSTFSQQSSSASTYVEFGSLCALLENEFSRQELLRITYEYFEHCFGSNRPVRPEPAIFALPRLARRPPLIKLFTADALLKAVYSVAPKSVENTHRLLVKNLSLSAKSVSALLGSIRAPEIPIFVIGCYGGGTQVPDSLEALNSLCDELLAPFDSQVLAPVETKNRFGEFRKTRRQQILDAQKLVRTRFKGSEPADPTFGREVLSLCQVLASLPSMSLVSDIRGLYFQKCLGFEPDNKEVPKELHLEKLKKRPIVIRLFLADCMLRAVWTAKLKQEQALEAQVRRALDLNLAHILALKTSFNSTANPNGILGLDSSMAPQMVKAIVTEEFIQRSLEIYTYEESEVPHEIRKRLTGFVDRRVKEIKRAAAVLSGETLAVESGDTFQLFDSLCDLLKGLVGSNRAAQIRESYLKDCFGSNFQVPPDESSETIENFRAKFSSNIQAFACHAFLKALHLNSPQRSAAASGILAEKLAVPPWLVTRLREQIRFPNASFVTLGFDPKKADQTIVQEHIDKLRAPFVEPVSNVPPEIAKTFEEFRVMKLKQIETALKVLTS